MGTLVISAFTVASAAVNLSTLTLNSKAVEDWVVPTGIGTHTQKSGATLLSLSAAGGDTGSGISDGGATVGNAFSWTDGDSPSSGSESDGVRQDVFNDGESNYWQFTCAAGTGERTLRVWMGRYAAAATSNAFALRVTISDGSTGEQVAYLPGITSDTDGYWDITFAANSEGQTITVRTVSEDVGANLFRTNNLRAYAVSEATSSGPTYATGSFDSAFSIRNYTTNSFNSAYSIRNYIAAAFNSAFSIRNFSSGDYTSAFSIKNFVSGDYASAYSIRNYATGGFSSAFSILGVETVSGSFSSAYSIRNYANAAFDSAFSIRNFVSGDYDSAYSIRKLVSGDFDSAFSIRNFATGEYSSAYSIIAYATGSFDSAFSIRNYVTGNYSSAFSIAAVVIATGSFDSAFSIRNFISGSYNSSFSINFTEGRLKQAIKEAYASAPAGVIVIHTLEFRHPNFRDNGQPTSIKVVLGHSDLEAKLEDSAPLKPGQYVTFVAMAFDLDLPNIEHLATPEVSISIDNVSREIEDNLMTAAASPYPVEVTYRPYLNTDLTGPQMDPPLTLTLISAEADDFSVKARAIYGNAAQVLVPRETYTADRFPGVQR